MLFSYIVSYIIKSAILITRLCKHGEELSYFLFFTCISLHKMVYHNYNDLLKSTRISQNNNNADEKCCNCNLNVILSCLAICSRCKILYFSNVSRRKSSISMFAIYKTLLTSIDLYCTIIVIGALILW